MGLSFSRSVKLGAVRFNFSGSGIGMSVGIPGLRIGTGLRGVYISGGVAGFRYRQSLGGKHRAPTSTCAAPSSRLWSSGCTSARRPEHRGHHRPRDKECSQASRLDKRCAVAFEHIVEAVKAGLCQLPELLARAIEQNRNPATASYWLELQMSREAQAVADEGSLVTKAWEASLERLKRALGGGVE